MSAGVKQGENDQDEQQGFHGVSIRVGLFVTQSSRRAHSVTGPIRSGLTCGLNRRAAFRHLIRDDAAIKNSAPSPFPTTVPNHRSWEVRLFDGLMVGVDEGVVSIVVVNRVFKGPVGALQLHDGHLCQKQAKSRTGEQEAAKKGQAHSGSGQVSHITMKMATKRPTAQMIGWFMGLVRLKLFDVPRRPLGQHGDD